MPEARDRVGAAVDVRPGLPLPGCDRPPAWTDGHASFLYVAFGVVWTRQS